MFGLRAGEFAFGFITLAVTLVLFALYKKEGSCKAVESGGCHRPIYNVAADGLVLGEGTSQ